MNDIAIRAEDLGKRYRIGLEEQQHDTFVGALLAMARAPLRNYRDLKKLSTFGGQEAEAADIIWALREVSFDIKVGEVVGVIGSNGAGKSTLLKILSRITEPSEGRAVINGRVASLLEVGTGFHPELTGRENMYLNGTVLGMTKREVDAKFDEIVAFAEIERFIDTPVKRYSSGMKVRLAFAVAAFLEPEILLVDEVLSVGDASFQRKCLGKMQDVTQHGRTVLFVSHIMPSVRSLCDRAILMRRGQVALDGDSDTVVNQYLSDHEGALSEGGRLPDDVARMGSGEARIEYAALVDGEGVPTARLYLREPMRFSMGIETEKALRDVLLEVSVVTAQGVHVVQTTSLDAGDGLMTLEKGYYMAEVDIDPVLLPGNYSLTLGIHFSGGTTLDFVERVCPFEVLHVEREGDQHYPWKKVRGIVRPASSWRIGVDRKPALID